MRIKIIADSTCDLPADLIKKHDIQILPLSVIRGEDALKDNIDITPKEIFEYTDETGKLCSTAAINILDYEDAFAKALATHDAVICFTISSSMSSCYQNACLAVKSMDFTNIFIIDSMNLSSAYGLMVLEAAEMAEAGHTVDDIRTHMLKRREMLESSFLIDKLDFLHKGGRCSALSVMGANLMQLKPCIAVKDGKMHVSKKYRGHIEKALLNYVDERITGRDDIDTHRVFITYTEPVDYNTRATIFKKLRAAGFEEIHMVTAGSVISCHCGRSTLGILFSRKI